jgi:hypothetical protein
MEQNNNISQGYKNNPPGIIPKDLEVKKLGEIANCTGFDSATIRLFKRTWL